MYSPAFVGALESGVLKSPTLKYSTIKSLNVPLYEPVKFDLTILTAEPSYILSKSGKDKYDSACVIVRST